MATRPVSRLQVGSGSLRPLLRRLLVPALFVGALFAVVIWRRPAPAAGPQLEIFQGATMGTTYLVKVVVDAPLAAAERGALATLVEEALDEVDRRMSTWRDDSELSRFNRSAASEPFAASPALRRVMATALDVHQRSAGAFDVTVGPLVDAWGFGREAAAEPPSDEQIETLLSAIGSRHLQVDEAAGTLRKAVAGLRCDLSAIAKGYAVDRVAAGLAGAGQGSFMVEVGGEVVARGTNAAGQAWRLGIESPDPGERRPRFIVSLDDAALATSGDYRNYRISEGQRLSHILDPRTGRPVRHGLASVSVIAPSCMHADAWATALTVLGPDEGLEVAEREDLAVLLLSRRADGSLVEARSSAFDRYHAAHPLEDAR